MATSPPTKVEIIRFSAEDQRRIADTLLNPPEPTYAMYRAFVRYRELIQKVKVDGGSE